jgi:hypothetical protein
MDHVTLAAAQTRTAGGDLRAARRDHVARTPAWSFVYVFFSNGTPFDSPNRSETCRPA